MAYYVARGETPMLWGGTGAALLGLDGEVTVGAWRAVFGPGGAKDPLTGDRLVGCRRPGIELVVSPHKSVAELGVIGRAEDMHAIADAERDATLAYLDRIASDCGGRRGRSQTRTATGGLTWATSRHATTRAGDPQVHDHVLVANVVSMRDTRGGWKALDTALIRDHLHAATAIGRLAAAAKAVELGYGIEADGGRSGRLGAWAIAGLGRDVWDIHATRSHHIDQAVGPDATWRQRALTARATRNRKTHDHSDLVGRWQTELTAAGHPPQQIAAHVQRAGLEYQPPSPEIIDSLPERLLSPGGKLASVKTFTRADVIVAAAPLLHGLPVDTLEQALDKILTHQLTVPLPAVGTARDPVWAAATVIADEQHIAALADRAATQAAAAITDDDAVAAVSGFETASGLSLTDTQKAVAGRLLTSGRGLDVLIGVAGSGKTTTLAATAAGYEQAGYQVLGAATSGQAALTLQHGAGITAHTLASIGWQIDHHQLRLTNRHVVIVSGTGLTKYGQRYYDPSQQRWTQTDPLGGPGKGSPYSYVSNDPTNDVDSTGLVGAGADSVNQCYGSQASTAQCNVDVLGTLGCIADQLNPYGSPSAGGALSGAAAGAGEVSGLTVGAAGTGAGAAATAATGYGVAVIAGVLAAGAVYEIVQAC